MSGQEAGKGCGDKVGRPLASRDNLENLKDDCFCKLVINSVHFAFLKTVIYSSKP